MRVSDHVATHDEVARPTDDGQAFERLSRKVMPPAIVGPGATNSLPKVVLQGSWSKTGEKYQVKFQGDKGERNGEATVEGTKLTIIFNRDPLVFERD